LLDDDSVGHHTPASAPGDITHEIWFRAPSHITRPDIQRRHHMATRNFLALLYGLPIVGNDFFETLSDLQNVMDTYYELNEPSERWNSPQVLIKYLLQRQLDDVRGNLSHALGLMAWAEQPSVRWEAGYMEGFVHATGMMSAKTPEMREFRNLSQASRHKVQNVFNALQLKIMEAEDRLTTFDFPEVWYAEGVSASHPAQKAFDEFREFLCTFYSTVYGTWPPREGDHTGRWLSRVVIDRVQSDLGALYEYLVDRDVEWEAQEGRHVRKFEMVHRSGFAAAASFKADLPGLPVSDMLTSFDMSMKYNHIPHPYPLLPAMSRKREQPVKRKLLKLGTRKSVALADAKEQFQVALAFSAATNSEGLGPNVKGELCLQTKKMVTNSLQIIVFSTPSNTTRNRSHHLLSLQLTLVLDVGSCYMQLYRFCRHFRWM
jgi:hypothetical protein